jgi:BNR repeat protein
MRRLALLGAVLFLLDSPLSAQTQSPGGSGFPGMAASSQDEFHPQLLSGPNGEVFRLWSRAGDLQAGGGAVLLAVAKPSGDAPNSQDAWQNLVEIRPPEKGVNPIAPQMAIARPGKLAIVYQWRRNDPRTKQIRLARSEDGGKTWSQSDTPVDASGQAFSPQAAWNGDGSLVVVWADERRGGGRFDIYARRSPDGGKTWESEQLLSRFPDKLPRDAYAQPTLLSDGQDRLWAVWFGLRTNHSSLYLTRSTDSGRSWTDPVALTGDSVSVFGQQLVGVGDRMLLVWHDKRTGYDRLYAVSSTDAGATWTAPIEIDGLPADSPANAIAASVLPGPGGEALVAWQDERNGRTDIFLARSADGGRTWGEAQRMDMDEPGTAYSRFPKLARAKDGRVALVWEDDRSGFEAVYLRVRGTGERPEWAPEILVSSPAPKRGARLPQLLWGGVDGVLHIAWEVWDYTLQPARIMKQVDGRALRLGTH